MTTTEQGTGSGTERAQPGIERAEPGLTISPVAYTHPQAQRLIAATLADLAERYEADGDATPIEPAQFEPPQGIFLIAWWDGEAVGCGAWRRHGESDAEIKRMYTAPVVRGRGVARAVLRALEASARDAGRRRMILETGLRQPEAIALYESQGYRRIPNFGYYKDEPDAVCYARPL